MQKKTLTLSLIHRNASLLLGMKKRGFGEGKWNGFGGKLKEGESIEQAATRELYEEANVQAHKLEKRGIVLFQFPYREQEHEVHIFSVEDFENEPRETEEMRPTWFSIEEIPFDEMWPDDRHWVPLFLEEKTFRGNTTFDQNDMIVECEFYPVDML